MGLMQRSVLRNSRLRCLTTLPRGRRIAGEGYVSPSRVVSGAASRRAREHPCRSERSPASSCGPERILLQQRPAGRIWAGMLNGPGGKVDPGETSADAVVREVLEETGLRIIDPQPADRSPCTFRSRGSLEMEVDIFVATNFEGDALELEGALAWYDREAPPFERMWADQRYWLAAVLDGFTVERHGRLRTRRTATLEMRDSAAPAGAIVTGVAAVVRGPRGGARWSAPLLARRSGIRVALPLPPSEAAGRRSCSSLLRLACVVYRAKPRPAVAVVERLDDGRLPAADGDHILLEIAGRAVAGRYHRPTQNPAPKSAAGSRGPTASRFR